MAIFGQGPSKKELLDQMNEENKEQILESIYIGLALM